MKPVFADTSFFIAFLCADDKHHAAAHYAMKNLKQPLLTSYWVLLELGNYLSRRPERTVLQPFIDLLRSKPTVRILQVDEDSFIEGLDFYTRRGDKAWSLTDCSSIVAMQRHKLSDVLTTDHHFTQAGFNVLLK